MGRLYAATLFVALSACSSTIPANSPHFPVYFEPWSAAIGPDAEHSIAAAAELARQNGSGPVVVAGYADPTGSAAANILLSRTRAQVVMDALIQHGVAAARILRSAHGATPVVQDLQESRRVDIIVEK